MSTEKKSVLHLSDLRLNEIGQFVNDGRRFIVSARYPEDRASGVTEVTYENLSCGDFVWDRSDPEVIKLGEGKIKTVIDWGNN